MYSPEERTTSLHVKIAIKSDLNVTQQLREEELSIHPSTDYLVFTTTSYEEEYSQSFSMRIMSSLTNFSCLDFRKRQEKSPYK